jgi:site-specific DNA-methyltransferase (adenine-specific)
MIDSNCGYNIILADPPWRFQNWSIGERAKRGEKWARRNGRSPYDVMATADIAALPVADIAARDSVLFLWATYPKLQDAMQVMAGWGFTYKTVAFTWVKNNPSGVGFHFGLGYWTRQNPESVLLGTRGKPKRVCNRVPNLLIYPRGEHSKKPPEVHDRIVRLMGDLPRVELFARRPVDGWDVLGNEIDGRDIRQSLVESL